MSRERVGPCVAAGATGVAVVSGVLGASDPAAAACEYRAVLEAAAGHARGGGEEVHA